MNQDTIENHVKNLGKRDFDAVAQVILTSFFGLTAIDVDGKGDGGSDLRIFSDRSSNKNVAIQKTVVESQWEKKALDDARKAKEQLGAQRYFFLTSRAHESTAFRSLENKITSELGMPATCLGATEIAGIIYEQGLLKDFAQAIELPLDVNVSQRPDRAEILLHAYVALGSDRSSLRDEVYDDSLLIALHEANDSLTRDSLVKAARELLGTAAETEDRLGRRIDSLLTRQVIESVGQGQVHLTDETSLRLKTADGIYVKELEQLASAQSQVMKDICSLEWDKQQCASAATLLSRWFIHRQLTAAEHTSIHLTKMGLSRYIGNPEAELRQLLREAGVPTAKMPDVLDEFVSLASGTELIKKLTRAVTFVATEGQDILKASRVLGASNWSDVTTTLDASVAIPYLCSSLFTPTRGRFSFGSNQCINLLKSQQGTLVIPRVYINEVASHLRKALTYPEIPEFNESLEQSRNGFVAHYFQLKSAGRAVPDSLREFVAQFSRAATRQNGNEQETIRAIMADIQPLLASYGIYYDDISRVPQHFRDDVEKSYSFKLAEFSRKKTYMLIDHDVQVLAHARRAIAERSEIRMCLTWDRTMIAVGLDLEICGWIVSPHEAADVIHSRMRVSDAKLTALAHSLARARERPSEKGARIIDRVVQLAGEQLQDWQFRQKLKDFYSQAMSQINLMSDSYDDIDKEIDEFLTAQGISPAPSDVDAGD